MSAGAAYVFLNILRFLSILALITACTASILVITVQAQEFRYFFFSICGQLSRIVGCFVLIVSEVPVRSTTTYLRKTCAALTHGSSLAYTGWGLLVVSVSVLSDLTSPALSDAKMGSTVRGIVLAAGSSLATVGLVYAIMPIVYFRHPAGECRRVRTEGAVPRRQQEELQREEREMEISRPLAGSESGGAVKFPDFNTFLHEKKTSF